MHSSALKLLFIDFYIEFVQLRLYNDINQCKHNSLEQVIMYDTNPKLFYKEHKMRYYYCKPVC